MRHGINIPADQRDDMARQAWALRQQAQTYEAIAFEFDVSSPTARNLVARGKTLAEDSSQ